ncbi:hypothetical protein DdX_09311 [Ditylenchus destructor]|uniref:DUF7515 domain-containing protein n=1 Tax=Ditylenchus destructor TaxID=166010 RepID=A0AAD4N3B7_9BILA|nr:hypothetical protein DdX_09311 [Ditylenchus destructor]
MQQGSKKKEITPKEKVKLVLQSRVEGYENIGHLLNDLQTDFGVNGNTLANSFNFYGPRAFDLFLRSEEMRDICEVEDRADEQTIYRAAYDRRVQHIWMEMIVSKREGEKRSQIEEDRRARRMAYSLAEPCGSYRSTRQNQRAVDRNFQNNFQSTETIYKRDARKLNTPSDTIDGNDRPNSSSVSNNHFAPIQVSKESQPNPPLQIFNDGRLQKVAPNEMADNRYHRNIQMQNGSASVSNNHFAPIQLSKESQPNPPLRSFNNGRLQKVAPNEMAENRYHRNIQIQNGSSSETNNHFTPIHVSNESRSNQPFRRFNDDRSQRVAQDDLEENGYRRNTQMQNGSNNHFAPSQVPKESRPDPSLRNIQLQNGSRRPPTPRHNKDVEESDEEEINDWDYEAPKRTKKPTPKSNHVRANDQYHFAPIHVSNDSRSNQPFRRFNDDRLQRVAQDDREENRYRRNIQLQNGSRRPPTPRHNKDVEESDEEEINDWDYEAPKRTKKPTPKSNHVRANDQYHFAPIRFNDGRSQRVARDDLEENGYRRNIQGQGNVFAVRNSNRHAIPIPSRVPARTEPPISFFARFGTALLPKTDDGVKSRQSYRGL